MAIISLNDVRALCRALPDATERASHGSPSFFVGNGRMFATYADDHHGDGRLALWIAAPEGAQEAMIASDPDQFFRPPYVGHRGWLGVHLDHGIDRDLLAELLADAYVTAAPPRRGRLAGDA